MKKLAIVLALMVLAIPFVGQAQSQWSLGVGAEGGLPTGDFNTISSFGIGGLVFAGYNGFDPAFQVTLSSGYVKFSGKDYPDGLGGTANTSYSMVPILVGGKYYFMPGDTRVYGQANVGLYLLSASVSGSVAGSASSTKFGFSPVLGAQFKAGDKMAVDVHANYTDIMTDVSSTSYIGFGIGLVFDLQ
jgi:opacity protein-like surface antigen